MVNYDLPWNPNRIEQRFGRIHRIGQEEVCRLWNLVASNTREGDVFVRLLAKISGPGAYGGKVFDVLGGPATGTRSGTFSWKRSATANGTTSKPRCTRSSTTRSPTGSRNCSTNAHWPRIISPMLTWPSSAPPWMRRGHATATALHRTGLQSRVHPPGRIAKRERGRYEIANVPAQIRATKYQPIATRYDRVLSTSNTCIPTN